jgi:hypothetical protein
VRFGVLTAVTVKIIVFCTEDRGIEINWCNGNSLDLYSVDTPNSARTLAVMTGIFHGFPQSLQENVRVVP